MSAKMLPYRPRPSAEEKVQRIERAVSWRVFWWRAKRRAWTALPYVLIPLSLWWMWSELQVWLVVQ